VAEGWDRTRVLALAPDAPSQRTATSLASGRAWTQTGAADGRALWGECRGSSAVPYRTVVDLSGPAYRCSCPSRKLPCKHVLALMLLRADGAVADAPGDPPEWAATWLAGRAARLARATQPGDPAEPKDPKAALRRAEQREARVASGAAELDQWLRDQVRQGLAASQKSGYGHLDDIAARMVDAQASGLAERLRALAAMPYSGAGWDGRMLEEYALLRLLTVAYRGQQDLPGPLRDSVRARMGFTIRQADLQASGQPVRDRWLVLARRDTEAERIRTRRTWLRGVQDGRFALVLSFAPSGVSLDDSLPVGHQIEASLVFYPAAVPLRAVALEGRDADAAGPPTGGSPTGGSPTGGPPEAGTVAGMLSGYAAALGQDPWLDSWPAVLTATPARSPVPSLADADGPAIPLHPGAGDCWPLFALSGGFPLTLAGEWTPRGLWPLTAWDEAGTAVPL
jgi:hypothetical protein